MNRRCEHCANPATEFVSVHVGDCALTLGQLYFCTRCLRRLLNVEPEEVLDFSRAQRARPAFVRWCGQLPRVIK